MPGCSGNWNALALGDYSKLQLTTQYKVILTANEKAKST
jgi:hypothetical protein